METEKTQNGQQQQSAWKTAGRAASFVFLPRWFFSDVHITAAATRGLGRGFVSVLRSHHHESVLVDGGWNENVVAHGLTVAAVKRQVTVRQQLACIYLVMAFASLAAGILYAWLGYLILLLFASWYLRHVLALYQIREHSLCKIGAYLTVCLAKPENLLQLGLPKTWTLLTTDVGRKS